MVSEKNLFQNTPKTNSLVYTQSCWLVRIPAWFARLYSREETIMKTVRMIGLGLMCCFALFAFDTDNGNPAVTPEPGTIVMLATGLAAVGFAAWRRNRKR